MEIRVEQLRKTYQSSEGLVTALNGVDLVVPDGTVTTLLGPSGCGKTTLLRCIAGLETPDSGTIHIGDSVMWARSGNRVTMVNPDKRGIGMVFQTYAIWPHMTVFQNVAYPLESQGVPRSQIADKVNRALEFVQLAGFGKRPATALSGGQQQRVSLARAIVAEPRVILFDEPLSNLDAKLREETRAELRELLTSLAITSLYVTHDRFEALALSDDVVVMNGGEIVQRGSPEEVYFRSNSHFVVDFMGKANFLPAAITEVDEENGKPFVIAETAVGNIRCNHNPGVSVGERGTVAVRMEFIRILTSDEAPVSGVGVTTGTVITALFLGEYREVEVDANGELLTLRIPATQVVEPGDEVTLVFDASGCRFVTE